MRILKMVTITLTVCGCWQPESWSSPTKTVLYQAYTVIIISMVLWVTFCEFMDILLYVETQDEFADNLYIFVSMLVGCQKILNMLLCRKNIAGLLNTFDEEPFAPRNQEEDDVRSRFDKAMHTNTILYTTLLTVTCSTFSTAVFFKSEKWPLVFRAWSPYNYSTVGLYLPTVIQQSLALQYGAMGHVACDALFCGLIVHMCSQFEILGRRLNGIKRGEIGAVKSCIRCHDRLCRYARELNEQFRMVISLQFLASGVVVCFNLYRLTQSIDLGSKLPVLITYSASIMSQIFIYCWYGNEVKLKSIEISDVVQGMNWTELDKIQKKMILMMMCRSMVPIEFNGIHVATLNVCNLLGVCGCWIPDSWTSSSKRVLYCTYSAFVWLVLHLLSASQFCDLFINVKTQDDFTDNFYVTLSVLCICVKMSNLLLARRHLGNMIERIQKEPFSPTSVEEEEIRTRYDRLARRNAVVYTIAINSYVVSTCAMSLFTGYRKHKLLYRAWLPYDYSTAVRFSAAYIHQVVALFYAGLITVASDSLFNGFLIHTYCHFEILKHRLETIATEKSCSLKRCLHLHDRIYTYANTLNSQFKVIMVIQSMVSIVTVCCNLYQLTQKNLGSKFLEVIVYSFNTLVQIFYYCWYGNEIKLKSLDVPRSAFECNWTILDDKAKKFLLMMIKRAKVPIEFSVVHVVSMDLEMFTKILKTSYSAYNLMQ